MVDYLIFFIHVCDFSFKFYTLLFITITAQIILDFLIFFFKFFEINKIINIKILTKTNKPYFLNKNLD